MRSCAGADRQGRPYVRAKRFEPAAAAALPRRARSMPSRSRPAWLRRESCTAGSETSELYDHKLGMYKVNASLQDQSHEIGRARAFTPGWLENESIWLHMEYKYLLEVLRAGLYDEFYEDFKRALICFQDPAVYGRSPLENSSFLVSSAHPDASLHGAGFVARLSGATAEFLSIWTTMMAGRQPFFLQDGELCLALKPTLPGWLFDSEGKVTFVFLGHTPVTIHNPGRVDTWRDQDARAAGGAAHRRPGANRVRRRHRPCALRRDGAGRASGCHRAVLDVRQARAGASGLPAATGLKERCPAAGRPDGMQRRR